MNIIKMKVHKSVAAWDQAEKVNNPVCIAYGQNCPCLPKFYTLDSEIFTEDKVAPDFDEAIKKWGNNKPANVIIWTDETQEKNQWLIDLCLNNKDIIDFWFYCLPEKNEITI